MLSWLHLKLASLQADCRNSLKSARKMVQLTCVALFDEDLAGRDRALIHLGSYAALPSKIYLPKEEQLGQAALYHINISVATSSSRLLISSITCNSHARPHVPGDEDHLTPFHDWERTSMKGQSSADDFTALGGSFIEALFLLPPSVMAWARGMAPSLPVTPGVSAAPPSPDGTLVLLMLFPMSSN